MRESLWRTKMALSAAPGVCGPHARVMGERVSREPVGDEEKPRPLELGRFPASGPRALRPARPLRSVSYQSDALMVGIYCDAAVRPAGHVAVHGFARGFPRGGPWRLPAPVVGKNSGPGEPRGQASRRWDVCALNAGCSVPQ